MNPTFEGDGWSMTFLDGYADEPDDSNVFVLHDKQGDHSDTGNGTFYLTLPDAVRLVRMFRQIVALELEDHFNATHSGLIDDLRRELASKA